MADREKVINGLEHCTSAKTSGDCKRCPYYGQCVIDPCALERDALELLKEQEPVKPVLKRKALNTMYNDYVCPICNQEIVYEQKYCCECGRKVKWDD